MSTVAPKKVPCKKVGASLLSRETEGRDRFCEFQANAVLTVYLRPAQVRRNHLVNTKLTRPVMEIRKSLPLPPSLSPFVLRLRQCLLDLVKIENVAGCLKEEEGQKGRKVQHYVSAQKYQFLTTCE